MSSPVARKMASEPSANQTEWSMPALRVYGRMAVAVAKIVVGSSFVYVRPVSVITGAHRR